MIKHCVPVTKCPGIRLFLSLRPWLSAIYRSLLHYRRLGEENLLVGWSSGLHGLFPESKQQETTHWN